MLRHFIPVNSREDEEDGGAEEAGIGGLLLL